MADFSEVPIIDVNKDNFKALWPSIILAMKQSTFISLDLELSGLGNRKRLNAREMGDRYDAIAEVARTRSIIALGISFFHATSDSTPVLGTLEVDRTSEVRQKVAVSSVFIVQTYNITALCNEEYVVEPASLQFLIEHGFDFNKQYSSGVSYYRGDDKDGCKNECLLRDLMAELILSQRPIVLHNGLVDLVFLYHNLYAELPTTYATFLGALNEMFPAGLYDTKHICEFAARFSSSFLEYMFRRCQRENFAIAKEKLPHVKVKFLSYSHYDRAIVNVISCRLDHSQHAGEPFCQNYANHGWCMNRTSCQLTHNIDVILDNEIRAKSRKRRRPRRRNKKQVSKFVTLDQNMEDQTVAVIESAREANADKLASDCEADIIQQNITNDDMERHGTVEKDSVITNGMECNKTHVDELKITTSETNKYARGHRAGFDAFMTGFAMSYFINKYGQIAESNFGLTKYVNRLSLSGKDVPLLVCKSNFAGTSVAHTKKFSKIKSRLEV